MQDSDSNATVALPTSSRSRRAAAGVALLGACFVGAALTAAVLWKRQPTIIMLTPAPIASMQEGGPVAIKGAVVEIFGNKFVVQDESGRALIETGPRGEGVSLVSKSEAVAVRGRFEYGFVHAQTIAHPNGHVDVLNAGPPHPGLRPVVIGDADAAGRRVPH